MKKISGQNKNVLFNIIGAFFVKGGSLVISVFLLPLYIRFFENQEVLGVWFTAISVLNWVVLFDLGMGQGLRNQLPKALTSNDKILAKEYVSTTYILMSIVTVIVTVIGLILLPRMDLYSLFGLDKSIIPAGILEKSVRIVFIGIMIQIVLKIITSILYAMQKSAIVNALGLLTNAIILFALYVTPSRGIASNLITMSWINIVAANFPYVLCTVIIFKKTELKEATPSFAYFSKLYIKSIFSVGMSILWLQIVFMVVSSANEFLISILTSPKYVVEYQAYYKIFKTAAMIVSLALTPIWSAVTKAQIENNYGWIKRIYCLFLGASAVCFIGELCLIPVLQWGMNIWLGEGVIEVHKIYAIIFVFSSVVFVLHSVNTAIGNGLSYFKLQMVLMTFAAIVFVPLSIFFVDVFNSWIGVVLGSVVAMLPYEVLAPVFTIKYLNNM
jgi:O-antigen/teichoic acid export membrane protein